jgi:cobalamin-dependent methionine synthase I
MQEVRTTFWGYAADEKLTMEQLLREDYQGIRPAVGYPSMPDTSINFLLDEILGMKEVGIRLTESGMMTPHASVSGLMFSHPKAHDHLSHQAKQNTPRHQ